MTPVEFALIARVLIAVSTRTFFQPDEYFQALEPAHYVVFGYGHLTWEWRIPTPIRSIIYPGLNIPLFWFLKAAGLSENHAMGPWLLVSALHQMISGVLTGPEILLPKVIHGLLAACTDVASYKLARKVLGQDYAQATVCDLGCL